MLTKEIDRVKGEPKSFDDDPGMPKVKYIVNCDGNAEEVLSRVKNILLCVLQNSIGDWPELNQWKNVLPDWFLKGFSNEMTDEEARVWLEKWRPMSPEEQARAEKEKGWSFSNWIGWFNPNERYWYWWDASVNNASTIDLTVLSKDIPSPHGSLMWLFVVCGANSLEAL